MAPQAGFEPATLRLTAGCSAVELLRNVGGTVRTLARSPHRRRTGPDMVLKTRADRQRMTDVPLRDVRLNGDLHRPAVGVRHGAAALGFLRELREAGGVEPLEP